MGNAILNAALEYASRGWSVIPISREKRPLIKWREATREELTNKDNIKKWWNQYPTANVAIVTGERSGGLVVIDLDVDDDKGIDGRESLEKWCDDNDLYPIESCATVATGRGGQHLYFQSDFPYHNHVGCLEGVDIRGEGGCIIAPPSIHGTTSRNYVWDIDEDDVNIPKADSDVVFFLASMEAADTGGADPGEKKKNNFAEKTEEGGRNNKLFKYVSKLQGEGETDDDIKEYADIYNKTHLHPPLDDDEVERTIASVLSHKDWKGTSKKEPKKQDEQKGNEKPRVFRKLKTAEALMEKDIPEPIVYVGVGDECPLLVEGTCILSAKPKLGKSWFALDLCLAVAAGRDFVGYKTRQCSTLYLDLETSEPIQKKRLTKALKERKVPKNFYLEKETDPLNNGFVDQIEAYLKEDPDIGVIVIDVFQLVRSPAKNMKETEYEHAYRDISPLNELAQRHHISIILVCHDRKTVDDDPFANILGSTGLQGAVTQMIVMFKRKQDGPIHISVKGKTIDGLPELDVELVNAEWHVVEGNTSAERERQKMTADYRNSEIRQAVIAIANNNTLWKGRCKTLIEDALSYNIGVQASPKEIGGFLNRFAPWFLNEDGIKVSPIKNGCGSKLYKICKSTVDTVDENEGGPLTEWKNIEESSYSEDIFL